MCIQECWFEITKEQFGWIESDCVPQCLLQRVKKIEIIRVQGDEDEQRVIEYFLQQCKCLEVMIINCKALIFKNQRKHLRQRLSHLKRGCDGSELLLL